MVPQPFIFPQTKNTTTTTTEVDSCGAGLWYAFDSVQTQAILTSLQEQGIEDVYIEILKDIYTDSSVTVHLHKESEKIRIKRGVRQGDTISPKLFTATL